MLQLPREIEEHTVGRVSERRAGTSRRRHLSDELEESTTIELSIDELKPYLAPGNPFQLMQDDVGFWRDDKGMRLAWRKSADVRFVPGPDGTILDRVTGLAWAAADSGKDSTQTEASAYVAAYRGGGHSDWRLPTIEELEELADPDDSHRSKDDCAHGKYAFGVTPLVHLSCGLAWSSDRSGDRGAAFGFVSGTSRWVNVSEKKNLRALPVRRQDLAGAPPKTP